MALTNAAIKAAQPRGRAYKLYDDKGLFMLVKPAGGRLWRLKYRFGGKEKTLALGVYPQTGLKEARDKRDEARRLLGAGVDPGEQKKAEKDPYGYRPPDLCVMRRLFKRGEGHDAYRRQMPGREAGRQPQETV